MASTTNNLDKVRSHAEFGKRTACKHRALPENHERQNSKCKLRMERGTKGSVQVWNIGPFRHVAERKRRQITTRNPVTFTVYNEADMRLERSHRGRRQAAEHRLHPDRCALTQPRRLPFFVFSVSSDFS